MQRFGPEARHQTHLTNSPLEKGDLEGLNKKEKGLRAAQWLMETSGKKYLHASREVEAKEKTTKMDSWMSEKQATNKFGWNELVLHCNSGRVVWRQDPSTAGVYQHKDPQDFQSQVEVSPNGNRDRKWNLEMRSRTGSTPCTIKMPCPLVWRT